MKKFLLTVFLLIAIMAPTQTIVEPGLSINNTFTANNFFTNAGVFSNTQMNDTFGVKILSCVPATEIQATLGAFATPGVEGCVVTPGSGFNDWAFGVGGYIVNQQPNNTNPAVGVFGQARGAVTGSLVVGGEFWTQDVVSGGLSGLELQTVTAVTKTLNNSSGPYQIVNGYFSNGVFAAAVTGSQAYRVASNGAAPWNFGYALDDGSTILGLSIGTTSAASGASAASPIQMAFRASGTVDSFTSVGNDSTGDITLTPSGGNVRSSTGFGCSRTNKSANYTLTVGDCVVLGNAGGGSFTLTLPHANANSIWYITRTDQVGGNTLMVQADSGNLNNVATVNLATSSTHVAYCDGTNCWMN